MEHNVYRAGRTVASPPDVLVFGPQSLSFDTRMAEQFRSQLLEGPGLVWIYDALKNLHIYWDEIIRTTPALRYVDGQTLLRNLAAWLDTGKNSLLVWPLPNIILTPLVVAQHLIEYQHYISTSTWHQSRRGAEGASEGVVEIIGLCTGLLSSAAVSSSRTEQELADNGATAIRLAMLTGVVVDAKDMSLPEKERAASLAVSWTRGEGHSVLGPIFEQIPAAYISVIQNDRKVTVTATKATVDEVLRQLKQEGIAAIQISLSGFFHWNGHVDNFRSLVAFCDSHPDFQFRSTHNVPLRPSDASVDIPSDRLHASILESILVKQSDWHTAFERMQSSYMVEGKEPIIMCFGSEKCLPKSTSICTSTRSSSLRPRPKLDPSQDYVAVIGTGCHLPGAKDMNEFWDLLCRAESQHVEVPPERIDFDTTWRQSPGKKWFANLIEDHDTFDDRFFKKSPREAASTDPQQRLMLQVAYQAVEQSGYLSETSQDSNVGCYIAFGLSDYEGNISCHPANAFSATGNLKAFAAGKISHHFGWTGPGLTIDSACSSSAVAIHLACQSILSGECTAALAGGVNVMTGPEWFYNLAGASFLSPTGQCKPFDVKADGYCRGEAIGAVFLKKMSLAVRDNDPIFGVIAASSVQQNMNCTAITVPNEPSLTHLFRKVTNRAGLHPADVSFVEAHGTGTPVGDPAEYDSIRNVFGGSARKENDKLSVGSVKGLLGHAEAASGMVALLKILTMLHHGAIPPQASFTTLNPALSSTPTDHLQIATSLQPWNTDFRAALINNYGASGSNASLLVTQPPLLLPESTPCSTPTEKECRPTYPFIVHATDEGALKRYASKLVAWIKTNPSFSMGDLSFQLARQSNRNLRCSLSFSCNTMEQLVKSLQECSPSVTKTSSPRPVVLCFGGQRSTTVRLNHQLYDTSKILRGHLDRCNAICETLGTTIYPAVFQTTPIADIVQLHASLFSVQYACARSWLDCMTNVNVAAVVGHSLGELSALCVSGAVSLDDMLKFIIGRATLVRDAWGADRGSMLAVQGSLDTVEQLVKESRILSENGDGASVACFNAPTSFTLGGSTKAIDRVTRFAGTRQAFSSLKLKRLDVTNAYHCSLADSIALAVGKLASDISFHEPSLHIELATESAESVLDSNVLVRHLRQPVYFSNAVQRLSKKFESAVWLEAGTNSTVTMMANRTFGSEASGSHHFQAVNLTDSPTKNLSEVTISLWREGINVSYWFHHRDQANEYNPIMLPPYQFERTRHWMERKKPQPIAPTPTVSSNSLWSFVEYRGGNKSSLCFRIHTESERFQSILDGHVIGKTHRLCPSTLQLEIVVDALMSQSPKLKDGNHQPQLTDVVSVAPMSPGVGSEIWLGAEAIDKYDMKWNWEISSGTGTDGSAKKGKTTYVTGTIEFTSSAAPGVVREFAKLGRLVKKERCQSLLNGTDADDVIQGQRHIYKVFSDVVEYSKTLQGLHKLTSKGTKESAGYVSLPEKTSSSAEPHFHHARADCFCQVAGIFVNTTAERKQDEMYIANRIDQWIRSPHLKEQPSSISSSTYEVYACHDRPSEKEFISDVFVFEPASGELVEVILGIHYHKTPKSAIGRAIAQLNGSLGSGGISNSNSQTSAKPSTARYEENQASQSQETEKNSISQSEIASKLRTIIVNLSGLDAAEVEETAQLVDLGIDSLLGMELTREIENAFGFTVNANAFFELTDFQSLVDCVAAALGITKIKIPEVQSSSETEIQIANNEPGVRVNDADPSTSDLTSLGLSQAKDAGISRDVIMTTFRNIMERSDDHIRDSGLSGYNHEILPGSDELCIIYICDAFETLGCPIRSLSPGQKVPRIEYLPRHERFVVLLYELLETKAKLIQRNSSDEFVRTNVPAPTKSAGSLLQTLVLKDPVFASDHELTALVGKRLADCLVGMADGVQLIFGTPEGRELASAMYGKSPINTAWIKQLEDFLKLLISQHSSKRSIKILELGAGTGGTTSKIVPLLADLGVSVTYTVSDISSSLVAAARKRFRSYPFVDFRVVDIEREPTSDLSHSYDIVLATNCVHATHNLSQSTSNIHKLLSPDGFLLMLEMTEPLAWVDLVFGPLEGWWMFNDGRKHALVSPETWRSTLHEVGYGHVDWTEGRLPESKIQRLILAMASGPRYDRPIPLCTELSQSEGNAETDGGQLQARKDIVEQYVQQYTTGFSLKPSNELVIDQVYKKPYQKHLATILITGTTGSLGCHLTQYLSSLPQAEKIICLNRPSIAPANSRQEQALRAKAISLSQQQFDKLHMFQTDTQKPLLGLSVPDYQFLADNVTHIIHNAWPMSIHRPIAAFESQFRVLQNLIGLAADAHACQRTPIGFQFISSISVVGLYPLHHQTEPLVPEASMAVESVLPNGYSEAKLVCERMLEATLGKYPEAFPVAMSVRIGQIAGSRVTGYWNPVEHLAFVLKSSQALGILPDLKGTLSWCPVDDVAATLGELLLPPRTEDLLLSGTDTSEQRHGAYHIEHPIRKSWEEMIRWLAAELDVHEIVPFKDWLACVRQPSPTQGSDEANPAAKLADFLEIHFERMSCGRLVLSTERSQAVSYTLRNAEVVDRKLVAKYVRSWKEIEFLRS